LDERPQETLTSSCLFPLILKHLDTSIVRKIINRHLLNESAFWLPFPFRCAMSSTNSSKTTIATRLPSNGLNRRYDALGDIERKLRQPGSRLSGFNQNVRNHRGEHKGRFSRTGLYLNLSCRDFGPLIWFDLRFAASCAGYRSSLQILWLWFCEVRRAKALRIIKDAKSRTKWISDYRAFPNCDVERGHQYLATLCYIMSHGNNDIID
jgi:hypothetical protein